MTTLEMPAHARVTMSYESETSSPALALIEQWLAQALTEAAQI